MKTSNETLAGGDVQRRPRRSHYRFQAEAEEFEGPVCPAEYWSPADEDDLALRQAEIQMRRDMFRSGGDWNQTIPDEDVAAHLAAHRRYRQSL